MLQVGATGIEIEEEEESVKRLTDCNLDDWCSLSGGRFSSVSL
jgi:hypothetical protein